MAATVDAFTPAELLDGYVQALTAEISGLEDQKHDLTQSAQKISLQQLVIDDRIAMLARLRARHEDALHALKPPTGLNDLVTDLEPTA